MAVDAAVKTKPRIEIRGLTFAHRLSGHRADGHRITDISLQVAAGELCCLLGPNGAGKTTLLRCLLGLLTPAAGTVNVDGRPLANLSIKQRARQVAYVPQSTSSTFPFTALDIAVMGRTPHLSPIATPSASDRRHALRQLDRLGVAHLADRPFGSLSGGERQLTLIARALVQESPVLVLDEPTAALDFGNAIRVVGVARALARAGRTVLMTTHEPNHALTYGDHAVLLSGGRVIGDGPPHEVLTAEAMSALYGVAVEVIATPLTTAADRLTCVPLLPEEGATNAHQPTIITGDNK